MQYKCKICGGEMEFNGAGGFVCAFCGSKSFMSDADFKGNEEFRKRLLANAKAVAIQKDFDYAADTLWKVRGCDTLVMRDGGRLEIDYMEKQTLADYVCYLARESVVCILPTATDALAFLGGLRQLVFPEADSKLHRCFPELKMKLELEDGRNALVFMRRPDFYPAEMFAPWDPEHLAWVISRMENICCALEFSGITHGGLSPASIWINPVTHEGLLYGDWRHVRPRTGNEDLVALRTTAIELAKNTRTPPQLYEFLNARPCRSAFDDFAQWDHVIEAGFGGHRFVKM